MELTVSQIILLLNVSTNNLLAINTSINTNADMRKLVAYDLVEYDTRYNCGARLSDKGLNLVKEITDVCKK